MKSYFCGLIFLTVIREIIPSECNNETESIMNESMRAKREPLIFREIKHSYRPQSRRKPIYGPPRPNYRPPKPIYGTPKRRPSSYGGPPPPLKPSISTYNRKPPIYHHHPPSSSIRQPSFGPMIHHGYNNKPIYGPPSRFESLDNSNPSSSFLYNLEGSPEGVSDFEPPPPPPKSSSNTDTFQYETLESPPPPLEPLSYGPPETTQHHNNQPPSTNYGVPSISTSYSQSSPQYDSAYHQSYDIPAIDVDNNQPLTYDTSSASYGTPGAVNSYGVPINTNNNDYDYHQSFNNNNNNNNNDDYSNHHQINNAFDDASRYSHPFINAQSSSNNNNEYAALSKLPFHEEINTNLNNEQIIIDSAATTRSPNHNYDGPGVQDDYIELYKKKRHNNDNGDKKITNPSSISELVNDVEILKSHSFNYFGGKSRSLGEN